MLVGTRYATATIDDRYNVVVVGSGLGGLTTAALLSMAGRKVLVLERHYTAGGFTHSYRRRGFEWDVGVHYVGEMHKPQSRMRRVFDAITDSQLQWAQLGDPYDRIIVGADSYDFVAGADGVPGRASTVVSARTGGDRRLPAPHQGGQPQPAAALRPAVPAGAVAARGRSPRRAAGPRLLLPHDAVGDLVINLRSSCPTSSPTPAWPPC